MAETRPPEQPTANVDLCSLGATGMVPREAARLYHSAFGWPTVPCRITYVDGKKKTQGLPRNYPALTRGDTSWGRIAKLWDCEAGRDANAVAHVLRPGCLVVDLDGPSADDWLVGREFAPGVPCLKTGNGLHYLFHCPEEWDFDLLRLPVGADGSKVEFLMNRLQFVPPCPDGRIWLVPPGEGGLLPPVPCWLRREIERKLRRRRRGEPDRQGPASGAASVPPRPAGKSRTPATFGALLDGIELREWRQLVPDLTWNGDTGHGSCPLHDDSHASFSLYRRRRSGVIAWRCHAACPASFTGVRGGKARHGGNLRDLRRLLRISAQRTEAYERAAGAIFKLDLSARARRLALLVVDKARQHFLDLREPVGFSYREAAFGGLDEMVTGSLDRGGRPRTTLRHGGWRIRRAMDELRAVGVNIVKGEPRCARVPYGLTTTYLFPPTWLVDGQRVSLASLDFTMGGPG